MTPLLLQISLFFWGDRADDADNDCNDDCGFDGADAAGGAIDDIAEDADPAATDNEGNQRMMILIDSNITNFE